jgi:hypothetical protein
MGKKKELRDNACLAEPPDYWQGHTLTGGNANLHTVGSRIELSLHGHRDGEAVTATIGMSPGEARVLRALLDRHIKVAEHNEGL